MQGSELGERRGVSPPVRCPLARSTFTGDSFRILEQISKKSLLRSRCRTGGLTPRRSPSFAILSR